MDNASPLVGPRRPRGLSLGLNRVEWALDAAAMIAIGVELAREISTGSFTMFPVLLLATAITALRRHFPIFAAGGAILISGLALFAPPAAVPIWVIAEVCLFSLSLRSNRTITVWFGLSHAALLYGGAIVVFQATPFEPLALILPVWTAAVIAVGLFLRTNNDYVHALERHSQFAAAHHESEVQHRVNEERLRIARDLHDSVAHSVSAVSIHAGAAERHLDKDLNRARSSLQQVRASTRIVVDELQNILGILRHSGELTSGDEQGAVPGIEGISSLVEQTRTAGIDVEFESSFPESVEPAVSVAAYRVIQESLTNARKHAEGPVFVSLSNDDKNMSIEVTNPLRRKASENGKGFGLVGMHERVDSVHGTLHSGVQGQHFKIHAVLPLHTNATKGTR